MMVMGFSRVIWGPHSYLSFCYRTIVNIVRGLVLYLDCSLPGSIREGEVECKKNRTTSALNYLPQII